MNPGGLPKNSKKVNERGCMQRFAIEGGNPLFGENLRRMTFTNSFYYVTDKSFTADGGLL